MVPAGAALPTLKAPGKSDLWNFGRGLRGRLGKTRMPQLSLATRSAVHSSIAPTPGCLETQTYGVTITHRTSFHPAYARLRAMSKFLAPRAGLKGKHCALLAMPAPGSSPSRPHPAHQPSLGRGSGSRTHPECSRALLTRSPPACELSCLWPQRSSPTLPTTANYHPRATRSEPRSHNLPLFREHTAEGTQVPTDGQTDRL